MVNEPGRQKLVGPGSRQSMLYTERDRDRERHRETETEREFSILKI